MWCVDENVIHVNCNVSFINEFVEEVIHHRLEGSWGVRKAEKHDHGFEQSSVSLKGGLPLVAVAHMDVIIPPMDIQLREERQPAAVHPRESIHKLPNERKWGGIANHEGVQSSVVLDRSKIAVLLLTEEERGHVRGFGLAYIPLLEVFCDEFLQSNIFGQGQRTHFAVHSIRGVQFQVDSVIPFA